MVCRTIPKEMVELSDGWSLEPWNISNHVGIYLGPSHIVLRHLVGCVSSPIYVLRQLSTNFLVFLRDGHRI